MNITVLHRLARKAHFLVFAFGVFISSPIVAEPEASELLEMGLQQLMTIQVGPSADASAAGVVQPYAGGLIAYGGREGVLGSENYMEASFNSKAYTREFLKNQQVTSVGDLLRYDPVLRVARGFGNFQQVYISRGFPIFSDDMTYNGLYGILPRQYLAAELIERVELVRSGSAFLFAAPANTAGSFGGGINVMPKRAQKEKLTELVVGNRAKRAYAAADISRRFNEGRAGVRFNLAINDGETNVEEEQRSLVMSVLGLDYQAESMRFSADLGYQNHELNGSTPSITMGFNVGVLDAPDAGSQITQPWTYAYEEDFFGTFRAEFDVRDFTAWVAVGGRHGEEDSVLQAFSTVFDEHGNYTAQRFDVVHHDHVLTGELGVRWRGHLWGIRHELSSSAHYFRNRASNAYAIYEGFTNNLYRTASVSPEAELLFGDGDLRDPSVTLVSRANSIVIADEIYLLDDSLKILLGARYQNFDESSFTYDGLQQLSRYDDGVVSPAFSLVYQFDKEYAVFVNRSEGIARGVFAEEQVSGEPVLNAGEIIEPIKARQSELGLRFDKNNVGGSISLYGIRRQLMGLKSDNYYGVTDYQVHHGVELSVFGMLNPELKVMAGMGAINSDIDGMQAIGVPDWQFNFGLEYEFPRSEDLILGMQYMYTSAQYADAANEQRVPAWGRLDGGLRYSHDLSSGQLLTVRVNVVNILGSDYWASAGGFPGSGYLTLGEPRSLQLSGSFTF